MSAAVESTTERPTNAADETATVYRFRKNSREVVVATVGAYNGHPLVGLRIFVPTTGGDLIPTQKGLSISVDQLSELEAAVRALREAVERGVHGAVRAGASGR